MLSGCSAKMSIDDVFGTYIASYPFGTETLTFNHDMTFVQHVQITGDPKAANMKGTWSFDSNTSYVELHDYLQAADGFGKLRPDWRKVSAMAYEPVERQFFKIIINSGAEYPYMKQ